MSENYQNSITDQICKVQTSKKLIALYDRLRYTSYNSYAQLHAKGEFEENGHKVHSLIGISIQDYSSGTGDKNIITRFHLAPEQIQFLLSRVTAGFPEFEWSQSKIFGVPDGNGYATTLNIDQQGRIIIPAKVRKALQLHTGDVLMLEADTRNICLRKCDSHIPMDLDLHPP